MNKDLKYKLDNSGIIALVVGVVIICLVSMFVFNVRFLELEMYRNIFIEFVIAIIATLFGPISGGLTAFIGVICATVSCKFEITYVDAISITILGAFIGQFAGKYGIRENEFTKKNIILWNLVHIMALIMAFVFVKPYLDYLIYDKELFSCIKTGVTIVMLSSIISGILLTVIFISIGNLIAYVKS